MNKIEKLIQELCPNGVEWKKLGEIGTFVRGNGLQKSDFTEYGFPCIHYGQIHTYYGLSTKETKSFCSNELASKLKKANTGDLIIATTSEDVEACCKATVWLGEGEVAISGDSFIYHHNQNPLYIAYMFGTELFAKQKRIVASGAKVVRVSGDAMAKIEIPLPPLPVQTEIVRILDKFVEQQEQLEKLIELRKKQYEYYREEMLTAKEGWESFVMSEICDLKAGKAISASELNDANEYPCFGGNGIRGNINRYSHEGNYSIIGRQGALCGCVNWATGKFYATEHAVVVTPKNRNNSRFLFILFTKADLNQYKSAGAQPGLSVGKLNELSFSIPSPERQTEIVKTLDSFESSISALTYALELSKKRYEHYRDEMLRF